MILTLVNKQILTLAPDNTGLAVSVEVAGSWAAGEHRIGEKKRIILEYTSDTVLDNFNFYITDPLFPFEGTLNTTAKPNIFYGAQYLPTTGIEYPCALQVTGLFVNTLPVVKNWEVLLIPDGSNSFSIVVDFFMHSDQLGNISTAVENHQKFLKDWYMNPQEITPNNSNITSFPSVNTVYQTVNISPRIFFYCESTDLPYPGVQYNRTEKFVGFGAGWYFKNKYTTDPWFTNTHFKVKRNGIEYTNLSDTNDSDVEVYATTENALNPVTHFAVWLIRTDKFDNTVDFIQNYEADFQLIKAANLSTSDISAPMTDPVHLGANQWMGTFKLKALTYGAKYRLIGIAYSNSGALKVNSFITGEYICDALPQYDGNGIDFRGALSDYNKQFEGNDLECVIEERMRADLKLEFPFNKWKNDIFTRLGLVTSNDIRRYLTRVQVEIFEEYVDTDFSLGTVKNIYDVKTSTKVGVNTYTSQSGLTMNFSSALAAFSYEWRNRFEALIPNVQTLINGVNTVPVMSTQYWGGKDLTLRWRLSFTYDNYVHPFTDDIIFDQKLRVQDYGGLSIKHKDPDTNELSDLANICEGGDICYIGIISNLLTDRKLINNIYPENGGLSVIEESEQWIGSEMNQSTTDKIINQDTNYGIAIGGNQSKFCIDGSKLNVNSYYVISALAKKNLETGFRITELEEQRITESESKRIIDNP